MVAAICALRSSLGECVIPAVLLGVVQGLITMQVTRAAQVLWIDGLALDIITSSEWIEVNHLICGEQESCALAEHEDLHPAVDSPYFAVAVRVRGADVGGSTRILLELPSSHPMPCKTRAQSSLVRQSSVPGVGIACRIPRVPIDASGVL